MSFLIRFGFLPFVSGLAVGSKVYSVAFSETRSEKAEAIVILTSDAGIEGGTIHAVRMRIEVNGTSDALTVSGTAFAKLGELFRLKGMSYYAGVLLTEGLNDALRFYSNVGPYSIKQIEEWLASEKKSKPTKRKKKQTQAKKVRVNERR